MIRGMTRTLWVVVLLFVVAQNLQVALYGLVSDRLGSQDSTVHRILNSFKDPIFLASLVLLSIATAAFRLWLFPHAGVARTHVLTSAAVVLSFGVFSLLFSESQTPMRYFGVALCGIGIYLVAR
jgi:drug/metabolite transporter (DMT)-like permease